MSSDDRTDKWISEFFKEAADFVAGNRKKYPRGLNKPQYVDPKRWPHKLKNGSKVSSIKEPKDGKVRRLVTENQQEYLCEIDREIEGSWTYLFVLHSIDRSAHEPAEYWRQMAFKLAEDGVPAFRTTNKPPGTAPPGAPLKQSLRSDSDLVMHIRRLQADLKAKGYPNSVLEAAEASLKLKSPRWKTAKGWMKPKSIEAEFLAARRRLGAEHKKGEMSLPALAALMPKP